MRESEQQQLQALLDRHGMRTLLLELSNLSDRTAKLAQDNSKYSQLARRWRKAALYLEDVADKPLINGIS